MFLFLLLTVVLVVVVVIDLGFTLGLGLGIGLIVVLATPLVDSSGVVGISGKERRGQVSGGLAALAGVAVNVVGEVSEDRAGVDRR